MENTNKIQKTKIILMISLLVLAFIYSSNAFGNHIEYKYDAAGNRIARIYVVDLKSKQNFTPSDTFYVEAPLGDFKVKVYPNPVKETMNVKISNIEKNNTVNMELYNTKGQVIKKMEKIENSVTIDMSPYGAGFYILQVKYRKKTLEFKVIKE